MSDLRVPTVDENGKLHPDVIPGGVGGGVVVSGGGPRDWSWQFPGALLPKSGTQVMVVPPIISGGRIKVLWVTINMFRLRFVDAVTGSIRVNGFRVAQFSLSAGVSTSHLQPSIENLRPGDRVTVDIDTAPAGEAIDLIASVWWEWVQE